VYCRLNAVPYAEKPLKADFSIDLDDYIGAGSNIVIANPNAPTGIALTVEEVERIVASNSESVVVIDEAYVAFGAESCIPLIRKYDNLLVVRTFSKSHSLAGARLGYAVGCRELIRDLNTIKYSTNPYNINRMTMAAGEAAVEEDGYYTANCRTVAETREYTAAALREMGFEVLPSKANFVFAKSGDISGLELYQKLKARGVLVRHFEKPGIAEYNRITIGTREQMDVFLEQTRRILKEAGK
jgi:histidinol-phosphate aminotransferase